MAVVYRAYQPTVDREVALKVFQSVGGHSRQRLSFFQREARLVARLEHPYILPLYDFDGRHDPPYLVMRYMPDGTLSRLLDGGPVPLRRLLVIVRQIAEALDYAHRQGVVHRDVKPSNIYIDAEEHAFVGDFSIARPQLADGEAEAEMVVGTPDYIAPEQIATPALVDERADVYGLGVTVFQMLTGSLPYPSRSSGEAFYKHLREPVPSVLSLNYQLPAEVEQVMQRALAKEPSQRYATAGDLVSELEQALGPFPPSGRKKVDMDVGAPPVVVNKPVTVLAISAAELIGYVDTVAGPDITQRALEQLWPTIIAVIELHGGSILNRGADSLTAVWGAKRSREDDAERAIRAGLAIYDSLAELAVPEVDASEIGLSVGLHSGLARVEAGQAGSPLVARGATTSLAQRLVHRAEGTLLISHGTYRLVRGIFTVMEREALSLRATDQQVATYEVQSAKERAFHRPTRGVEGVDTRMMGRALELETLQQALHQTVRSGRSHAVTVMGDAGLGKSRLLYEFNNWADLQAQDYWYLRGRAAPETGGQPYGLLHDIVAYRFDIRTDDNPSQVQRKLEEGLQRQIQADRRLAHLLGHLAGFDLPDSRHLSAASDGAPQLLEQAQTAFRKWLERLGQQLPVILELEDVRYGDQESLTLIRETVAALSDLPIFMISLARPSLRKAWPSWGADLSGHRFIHLRPLGRQASVDLIEEILQHVEQLPLALVDLLVDQAEGNPYYMEELIRMLIEERVIVKVLPQRWRVEESRLSGLAVPPTLSSLLQERLDGLLRPEYLLLQRAAVLGRVFHDEALRALAAADADPADDLHDVLARLVEQGLIATLPDSTFAGSRAYRFASNMLRIMLRETILARQAAAYSEAAAEWWIAAAGDRADEYAGRIADFYVDAGRDEAAAKWYLRAGQHISARGALDKARRFYELALQKLPDEATEQRWRVLTGLDDTLANLGAQAERQANVERLVTAARGAERPDWLAEAYYRSAWSALNAGDDDGAVAGFDKAVDAAQRAGAAAIEAKALGLKVFSLQRLGRLEEASDTAAKALTRARRLDDPQVVIRILNNVSNHYSAAGDLEQAIAVLEEQVHLSRQAEYPLGEAYALINLGYQYLLLGDYPAGRQALEASLRIAEEISALRVSAMARLNLGLAYVRLGDVGAAKRLLNQVVGELEQMGDAVNGAIALVYLGLAHEQDGRYETAGQFFTRAAGHLQELSAPGAIIDALAGQARCALASGDETKAKRSAEQVWERLSADGGQAPEFPIWAYLSCYEVFASVGQAERAKAALRDGKRLLKSRLASIERPSWRETFLANILEHAALEEIEAQPSEGK